MLKKVAALVLASIAVVLFIAESQVVIQVLLSAHDWVTSHLSDLFTDGHAGKIAKNLIALLAVPVFVSIIPTIACWTIRRQHTFTFFMDIVLFIWLIQTGALIATYHAAG